MFRRRLGEKELEEIRRLDEALEGVEFMNSLFYLSSAIRLILLSYDIQTEDEEGVEILSEKLCDYIKNYKFENKIEWSDEC